ncbi:hypothetical protein B0H19DRAFT_1228997 [Mycena capillaripes]|nr:hypothetical protein B0H19DRAFT_1228997 [Mycena capillaripes]
MPNIPSASLSTLSLGEFSSNPTPEVVFMMIGVTSAAALIHYAAPMQLVRERYIIFGCMRTMKVAHGRYKTYIYPSTWYTGSYMGEEVMASVLLSAAAGHQAGKERHPSHAVHCLIRDLLVFNHHERKSKSNSRYLVVAA